jgi:tRNA 2-thiouridine synthesizing protein E
MDQQKLSFKGKEYSLDRHGFLEDPIQWDRDFAEGMAEQQGVYGGLTEDHWTFILYLRNKFLDERTVPVVVTACSESNMRLNELRTLFPTGYHRGACRIAGINYAFMYESNIWLTYEMRRTVEAEHKVGPLGFLEDYESWNERFAHRVVRTWDLPDGLTDRHWKIIHYLRDAFRESKNIPSVFEACRDNSISLEELLGELFPAGYRRGACRAAGLPFFT